MWLSIEALFTESWIGLIPPILRASPLLLVQLGRKAQDRIGKLTSPFRLARLAFPRNTRGKRANPLCGSVQIALLPSIPSGPWRQADEQQGSQVAKTFSQTGLSAKCKPAGQINPGTSFRSILSMEVRIDGNHPMRAQIVSGSRLIPSSPARALASVLPALRSLQTRFRRTSRIRPAASGRATNSPRSISA